MRNILSKTESTACVLGDAMYIPLRENTIDFVVCTEVLEHAVVPTQLLLEVRRVLKPDGLLYLTVPHSRASLNPFRVQASRLLNAGDTHVNFYDLRGLQEVMTRSGFRVYRVRTLRDVKAVLKSAWRHPMVLRTLLPAWGGIIECVAQAVPDPIPYWESFMSTYA
jgi:SAM-dependent methyltransferase